MKTLDFSENMITCLVGNILSEMSSNCSIRTIVKIIINVRKSSKSFLSI